jgi:ankyrin repeat protein
LAKGASIEFKGNNGRIELWWAARDRYEAVVNLLLTKGADIELKDNKGRTPLS